MNGELSFLMRNVPSYRFWRLTVADLTVAYFVPLVSMTSLSVMVYREILRSKRLQRRLSATVRLNHRTARMLSFVVLSFISCYSLSLVLQLWDLSGPHWFITDQGAAVSDVSNILAILNSATSFLFYMSFSSRYQSTAIQLLPCLGNCWRLFGQIREDSRLSVYSATSHRQLQVRVASEANINFVPRKQYRLHKRSVSELILAPSNPTVM